MTDLCAYPDRLQARGIIHRGVIGEFLGQAKVEGAQAGDQTGERGGGALERQAGWDAPSHSRPVTF